VNRRHFAAALAVLSLASCGTGRPGPKQAGRARELALEPAAKKLALEIPSLPVSAAPAPLIEIMQSEIARSMTEFKARAKPAPYYLSYEVSDTREITVAAAFGALIESDDERFRLLDVVLRVGSPRLDNTHGSYETGFFQGPRSFPLDDDELAQKNVLWLATEERYTRATEELIRVMAQRGVNVREEDESNDFSAQRAASFFDKPAHVEVDRSAWEGRIRKLSSLCRDRAEVERCYVKLSVTAETRYFVSSEGTTLQLPRTHARIGFGAFATASDGDKVGRELNFDAHSPIELANDGVIAQHIEQAIRELGALKAAPLAAPYLGPAVLDGPAAAVFFHEILGHRVEGHRQKSEFEGQTFAKKIDEQVMPRGFDVYDDPNIASVNGVDLNGFYRFDGEGIRAQRAKIIDDGVFRGFLMSRSPIRGFPASNGHGRREPGYLAVARQASLVVDPATVTTKAALKRALLEEVARQKKPYGLRIGEVTGGYTMTERGNPQAFQIQPAMVFRVYPDGREELVRGVTLEGMPLSVMARVLGAGDDFYVFNGYCGAESGQVPASAISPSLLVSQIEIARQQKSVERPPLLPAPSGRAN
jgi:predicted Zn-dependent protease